jgi:hypothetical protein
MKDVLAIVLISAAVSFIGSKNIEDRFFTNKDPGSAAVQKEYTAYHRFYIETSEYSAGYYQPLPFGDTNSPEKRAIYPSYPQSGLHQFVSR